MKISKVVITVFFIAVLVILVLVYRFANSIGQHNASLAVTKAFPMQLAEAMQSDDFYGKYVQTMLLVSGTAQNVTQQGNDTLVQFEVTKSSTALGKVTCGIQNNKDAIKIGDAIRILTVAHDAVRKNAADIFMPNCYLLQ